MYYSRGCVSAATAKRKNAERAIGSEKKIARSNIGYRCDLIVREKKVEHEYIYEYCVGEAAIQHQTTITLEEKMSILPKILKDMLVNLVLYNEDGLINFAVFGIQYGLLMNLLATDRPSAHITRINHAAKRHVSSGISLFGQIVLPLLMLVWQIKQQIAKIKTTYCQISLIRVLEMVVTGYKAV